MKNKKQKECKKNNFFIDNYKKSLNYIIESKNFIYSIIAVFILFIILGAFFPVPELIEQQILEFIEDLFKKIEGMSYGEITWYIFSNNIQSSFLGMVFGFFLGIFPLITSVVNGYLLGFIASKAVQMEGIVVLLNLVPHGIFELPALFISLGLGLKLGSFVLQEKKIKSLKIYLINSFRVFLFVILPLLVVAAIIEGGLIFLFRS